MLCFNVRCFIVILLLLHCSNVALVALLHCLVIILINSNISIILILYVLLLQCYNVTMSCCYAMLQCHVATMLKCRINTLHWCICSFVVLLSYFMNQLNIFIILTSLILFIKLLLICQDTNNIFQLSLFVYE